MPSQKAVDSYSSSSSGRYQSSGNNIPSPAHHALVLHASGHFSCPISTRLFFSAYNMKHEYK